VRIRPRLRPVLIELGGRFIKADIVASDAEEPARVSMQARDKVGLRIEFALTIFRRLGLYRASTAPTRQDELGAEPFCRLAAPPDSAQP